MRLTSFSKGTAASQREGVSVDKALCLSRVAFNATSTLPTQRSSVQPNDRLQVP